MSLLVSPNAKLKGKTPGYATIFRLIDKQLRSDEQIKRFVKGSFFSWTGDPSERVDFTIDQAPAIRLTPMLGPVPFWANDSLLGRLTIQTEIVTPGSCWDDLAMFWYAVQIALYPVDVNAQNTFINALQSAGAHKGICEFGSFQNDPQPAEDGAWRGVGSILIDYRINVRS